MLCFAVIHYSMLVSGLASGFCRALWALAWLKAWQGSKSVVLVFRVGAWVEAGAEQPLRSVPWLPPLPARLDHTIGVGGGLKTPDA